MLTQAVHFGFRVGEVSCPTAYFPEASSINLLRSICYGLGVLLTALQFRLQRWRLGRFKIFSDEQEARLPATVPRKALLPQ